MGRASIAQHAFNAGEWSPLAFGRQDIDQYGKALATCLNAIPLVQGAWTRRSGTKMMHPTKFSGARKSRMLPFEYSITQAYNLEFGHQYIRFFANQQIVTFTPQNTTAITRANPAVLTYSGADTFANGDRVVVNNVVGMTQVNRREFEVASVNTTANTFQLKDQFGVLVDSTGFDAYTSGGTVAKILEVGTAFDETDLDQISTTQSADTLYLFHPDFPQQQLVRVTATSWTLSDVTFIDGPYDSTNTSTTTLTFGALTGSGVTCTASAVTGINLDTGFKLTDIGRLIRFKGTSNWGYAKIVTFINTTHVAVDILSDLDATGPGKSWRLGVWSDTTGFPACGAFYEDRLVMGGAALYPQRIDGSRNGRYTSFAPSDVDDTVANDHAVAFVMNSSTVNRILWIRDDEKGLLAGTSKSEWLIKPSSLGEALSPTNIAGKSSTNHGSAPVQPVRAGKAVLFVQRTGRRLRELAYVFQSDGFQAPDMTLLAEHITKPALVQLAYQQIPQAVVWSVRSDGSLLGFTYERDNSVTGWHRHQIAGGTVESIAVLPSADGTRDELQMTVRRTVNGQVVRYNEVMTKIWETGDVKTNAFYCDAGDTQVFGSPGKVVTGVTWLEGETIGVLVDGAQHPDVVVTNGKFTLNHNGTTITYGKRYASDGKSMPLDGGAQDGSAQGKLKKIDRIGFNLMDTLGLRYGAEFNSEMTEFIERIWGDDYGSSPSLFTGIKRSPFESDTDRLAQVCWRADGMYPATVLSIMPQFDVQDDT